MDSKTLSLLCLSATIISFIHCGPSSSLHADRDEDGFTLEFDCDDQNDTVYPGAPEWCDQIDNNCNRLVDEDPVDGTLWFWDLDNDGFGAASTPIRACSRPSPQASLTGLDCNDEDPWINPQAAEVCNTIDDNCDGLIDDDDPELSVTLFSDEDQDGFGDPTNSVASCSPISGFLPNALDCDDDASHIYPGAQELFGDEVDNNCNEQIDEGCGDTLGMIDVLKSHAGTVSLHSDGASTLLATLHGSGGVCELMGCDDPIRGALGFFSSKDDCSDQLSLPLSVELYNLDPENQLGTVYFCVTPPHHDAPAQLKSCHVSLESYAPLMVTLYISN